MTGGDYNRNGAKLIFAAVQREQGQGATDQLNPAFDQEILFGFRPGNEFHAA